MNDQEDVVQVLRSDPGKEDMPKNDAEDSGGHEREVLGEQESNLKEVENGVVCETCEARKEALNSRWGIASAIKDRYAEMRRNQYPSQNLQRQPHKMGALFVDFENIYLSLRDLVAKPLEMTIHVLTRLRDRLQEEMAVNVVMGRAYASWEYGASRDALSHLSLLGIVPQYVLSRPQKSSADLKLSIDLMEVLLTRDDINCFIIAGGDRDYMPIVEKIKERAKEIIIASPGQATSGDLIALVGDYSFIDATLMLPSDTQPASHAYQGVPIPVKTVVKTGSPAIVVSEASVSTDVNEETEKKVATDEKEVSVLAGKAGTEGSAGSEQLPVAEAPSGSGTDSTTTSLEEPESFFEAREKQQIIIVDPKDEIIAEKNLREYMHEFSIQDLWRCVGLIIRAQSEIRNSEIWVGPFLKNYMNEEFDFMNNTQRKRLLALMEEVGAVEVNEKMDRMGEQTYSVLAVKWDSPIIKAGLLRTKNASEHSVPGADKEMM